jgi:hypothetical protein
MTWTSVPSIISALVLSLGAFAALSWDMQADPRRVALAYLVAYAFGISIPLGVLAWSMICDACGAVWFVPLRRVADGITACFPGMALLFLPVPLSLPLIYPWAHHVHGLKQGIDASHAGYLNPTAFTLRAIVCFAVWIGIAETMRSWSLTQERPDAPDRTSRRRALAAVGLLPVVLTVTCMAIDWYLSLDATWFSSVYGLLHLAGDGSAGIAAMVMVFAALSPRRGSPAGRLPSSVGAEHAHALGSLLFVSVMFWAYLSFMQFLIIWMADLPNEAGWYVVRLGGTWGWLGLIVLAAHFVVPFALLLSTSVKRRLAVLSGVAFLVLMAHYGDLYWQLVPAISPGGSSLRWCDVAALIAVLSGGAACGLWRARGLSPIPTHDPDLAEGLRYRSLR